MDYKELIERLRRYPGRPISAYRAADAIEALLAEREATGWISVGDRLPDKAGHYLVCTSINYWHGGCLDKNECCPLGDGTPDGYFGTTMSVIDCYYDITGDWNKVANSHVTHWMPLPTPPDQEQKAETVKMGDFERSIIEEAKEIGMTEEEIQQWLNEV